MTNQQEKKEKKYEARWGVAILFALSLIGFIGIFLVGTVMKELLL